MSTTEPAESTWLPEHRELLALVRRHRARTLRLLTVCWLAALLGACSCLSPFAALYLLGLQTAQALFPDGGRAVPVLIAVGLVLLLVGVALGTVLPLLRLPGYRRTERLIAAAQGLGMRFVLSSQEPDLEAAAQSLHAWPSDESPGLVAGPFLGEREGFPVVLLEPGPADLFFTDYMPALYTLHGKRIFALFPGTGPEGRGHKGLSGDAVQSAAREGLTAEVRDGALAVSCKGDLANIEQCERLLAWGLKLRRRLVAGEV